MPLFRDKEIFDYPFEGEIKPQDAPYGRVYTFSVHGTKGEGELQDFRLGEMPHKDDADKVRRKGTIVLLSTDWTEFYEINFDCLYPCNSPTSILDMKCVVQEHPQVATRSLDGPVKDEGAKKAAKKRLDVERLMHEYTEKLLALDTE